MMTGTIKVINNEKLYGFITGTNSKDYFFHKTSLLNREDWNKLRKKQEVEFEPNEEDSRGPRAEDVIPLSD